MNRVMWLLLFGTILYSCGSQPYEPVNVGSIAPDFSLEDLTGKTVEAAHMEGEPTVLNFWATWCGPCKKEVPTLNQLAESGANVVSIALDEEGEKVVRGFVERNAIQYPVLLGNQEVFLRYSGMVIPYTLILDRQRKVVKIHMGPVGLDELKGDLANL